MRNYLAITLLELIVTLSIAAVLAFVTYGSLSDVKIKYRRKEAQTELVKIKALIQEQALKYNCSTIDIATWLITGTAPAGCSAPSGSAYISSSGSYTTTNKLYTITLNATNVTDSAGNPAVRLTATPVSSGPQRQDTECATITLTTSMGITDDTKGPTDSCWQ